ncbi:hypothetical protein KUW04_08700 [Halomonas denitrificans]|nr:hypothetical protein [Halomonas denitrificans]
MPIRKSIGPFYPLLLILALPQMALAAQSVDCANESLQTAIDAADHNAVLEVSGRCEGPFIITRSLTLIGRSATLSGNEQNPVLTIRNAQDLAPTVALRNLSITGGWRSGSEAGAAGLTLHNEANGDMVVSLTNVSIHDNRTATDGATESGGIFTAGPIRLTLADSEIQNNVASGDGGATGGIRIGTQSQLLSLNSTILHNRSQGDGDGSGGLDCFGYCQLSGGHIEGNRSGLDSRDGAGFTVHPDASLGMDGVVISDNQTQGELGGAGGGVIRGSATLYDTLLKFNKSQVDDQDQAGGLNVVGGQLYLLHSELKFNQAVGESSAGGLRVDGGQVQMENSLIISNQGVTSGGILLEGAAQLLSFNSQVRRNLGDTGGIRLTDQSQLRLDNGRIKENSGASHGGLSLEDEATATLPGSRISGNSPDNCSGLMDPACQ